MKRTGTRPYVNRKVSGNGALPVPQVFCPVVTGGSACNPRYFTLFYPVVVGVLPVTAGGLHFLPCNP